MNSYNIEINDLQASYEDNIIIDSLDLKIPKNKVTMIIGSNGCGKSTLLKCISRLLIPDKGQISINGSEIKKRASKELAKTMAVLPQSPSAPGGLLVRELVSYGRFPYQKPMGGLKKDDIEIINRSMEVTGIIEYADRPLDSLSGGQRQRAWIAMVLAQETEILILDEPTTYLDISHQLEILTLLKELNEKFNRTVVMVLHELNNAAKFADHLIGLKSGNVVFEGSPKAVVNCENLRILYGVNSSIQLDSTGTYPVCVDFQLAK